MKKTIIILLIVTIAFGDKLYLTNGKVVEGELIRVDDKEEQIHFSKSDNGKNIYLYDFVDIKKVTDGKGLIIWGNKYIANNERIYQTKGYCIYGVAIVIMIAIAAIQNSTIISPKPIK